MNYFLYPSRKLYQLQEYLNFEADKHRGASWYALCFLVFLIVVYLLPLWIFLKLNNDFGFMNWKELAFIFIWWGYLLAGKPKGTKTFK